MKKMLNEEKNIKSKHSNLIYLVIICLLVFIIILGFILLMQKNKKCIQSEEFKH